MVVTPVIIEKPIREAYQFKKNDPPPQKGNFLEKIPRYMTNSKTSFFHIFTMANYIRILYYQLVKNGINRFYRFVIYCDFCQEKNRQTVVSRPK